MSNEIYNLGRIGADPMDQARRDALNSKFSEHTLTHYYTDPAELSHFSFATSQPTINFSAVNGGHGISGQTVDHESALKHQMEQTRSLEKLQLNTRPFLTVPYLGRGSCDTLLECQLRSGENSNEKKSTGTIMTKSFIDHRLHPTEHGVDVTHTVEDAALDGWVRGGERTRQIASDVHYSQQSRPDGL